MREYFKLLVGFFLFFHTSLYGAEEVLVPEVETKTTTSPLGTKILYAKYTSIPEIVHTNEKFEAKIEATILLPNDAVFSLFTDIQEVDGLEKLTDEITWYKKEDTKYEATLTFQAKNKSFNFPIVELSVLDGNNNQLDKTVLVRDSIKFEALALNKNYYTNVTASNIKVENIKIKQYNNNELFCSMEIHGSQSNLRDFFIPNFQNQGHKEIVKRNGGEILYYFIVVPLDTTNIRFDYYNSLSKSITSIEIPIFYEEDLVSTQTGLNPNEGNMDFYKKVFFAFMTTLSFMLYYYKRWRIVLVFALFFGIILITMLLPNSHLTLKKEEKVYILPTLNSTIFKVMTEEEEVEVLLEKNGFKKVLFQNKHIGWVKSE